MPNTKLEVSNQARAGEAGIGIVIRGGVAKGEPNVGLGTAEAWGPFLRGGLDEATGRAAPSVGYAVGHVWRKWQNDLRKLSDMGYVVWLKDGSARTYTTTPLGRQLSQPHD